MFYVDTGSAEPIYMQIAAEVRRAVATGALRPDDPLPSVRQLAVELRVNPNTVQQAYRELEREGVVYVRRGQGSFIAPIALERVDATALLRAAAERALSEAERLGLGADALIDAVASLAREHARRAPRNPVPSGAADVRQSANARPAARR